MYRSEDTIAALSTPPGIGGIAVIRLSGTKSQPVLESMFRSAAAGKNESGSGLIGNRVLRYGHIVDENGKPLDQVLSCFMQAPKTYTREDMAEIHCHGGHSCVRAVLELVFRKGVRPAAPGEFTKRAFLNGRIDLTQAESVMDLIRSSAELSRQAAMDGLTGSLARKIKELRDEMLALMAHIEVSIDYPENEMEVWNRTVICEKAQKASKAIKELLDTWEQGKILREGIQTVILGRPNVGKSSLLNLLTAEDRAIVTDIPGTTRDLLTEHINLDGIPIKLTDTAGIRSTRDEIEKLGVERSRQAAESADLVLLVLDGSRELAKEDGELLSFTREKKAIVLLNKSDKPPVLDMMALPDWVSMENILSISALTGAGLDALRERIQALFFSGEVQLNGQALITNLRQKQALVQAGAALEMVLETIEAGLPEDLAAIDLRRCYEFLGEITGDSLDEDIIDKIFSEFCVGK